LGEFGLAAKPAIPVLLQALKSADSVVHGPAIAALGKIHGEPDTIIPLLMGYLDDKELNDEAATALGNFGSPAKVALPKLIPMLKIPDKDLHNAVALALKQIDPAAAADAGVR
jgi:HEAT repeat protein